MASVWLEIKLMSTDLEAKIEERCRTKLWKLIYPSGVGGGDGCKWLLKSAGKDNREDGLSKMVHPPMSCLSSGLLCVILLLRW